MREKLYSRFEKDESEKAIDNLLELGYLDDERFAENFIASKLRDGYGAFAIVWKLREKGVETDENQIYQVAEEREIDLESLAEEVFEKYFAKIKNHDKYKARQKAYAHLMRRGFDRDLIEKLLGRIE